MQHGARYGPKRDPLARQILGVKRDPVWTCPNTPQCPHPGLLHDVSGDYEDPRPTCCADGCDCGKEVKTDVAALGE